jgi:hypothetical protein
MHPRVQVRFTRSYPPYRKDDVASFPIDAAREIVARRVAVAIAGVGPTPAPGATPAPTPTAQRAPGQRIEK